MFILQSILFRVAPTALEISMVCGILVCLLHNLRKCFWRQSRLTSSDGILLELSLVLWSYTRGSPLRQHHGGGCWSYPLNYYAHGPNRTRFRREANVADNKAATVAIDSLINYEAVKVGFSGWYTEYHFNNVSAAFQQREIPNKSIRQAFERVWEILRQDYDLLGVPQFGTKYHFFQRSNYDDVYGSSRRCERCAWFILCRARASY